MIGAAIAWKFMANGRKTCCDYRAAVQSWQHIRSLSCLFHRQRGEQQHILLNPRKKIALSLCFKGTEAIRKATTMRIHFLYKINNKLWPCFLEKKTTKETAPAGNKVLHFIRTCGHLTDHQVTPTLSSSFTSFLQQFYAKKKDMIPVIGEMIYPAFKNPASMYIQCNKKFSKNSCGLM